jgi:hypothetical protein
LPPHVELKFVTAKHILLPPYHRYIIIFIIIINIIIIIIIIMTSHERNRNVDNVIASLMQEMEEQQGYRHPHQQADPASQMQIQTNDSGNCSTKKPLPRQLSELQGYPYNSYMAGSHSIWNPLVVGGTTLHNFLDPYTISCHHRLLLPTNPTVEVIRRRVFEKFRQEAQSLIQQSLSSSSSIAQQHPDQSWTRKLPIPSMLERWHWDAKLQEQIKCVEEIEKQAVDDIRNKTLTGATTANILRHRRSRGFLTYDPVLLPKQAPSLFKETLTTEVKKVWQPVWLTAAKVLQTSTTDRERSLQTGMSSLGLV